MTLLDTIEIETAPQPGATIIVLHGLGADGNDFVPVASELDLSAVGPVRFLFPHAPVMPVTVNNGYRMRAWYDILGTELVRREDEAGLRRSMAAVEQLLAREQERGVPASRTVLAGFSQGCAMALMTGLRHRERLAGIAGLSGYLPLAATTAAERSDANALTPVFMAHGTADNVVPIARGRDSRELLRALGQDVQWHEYAMAHSVCMEEIQDLNAWLLRVLARP
ncbi:MAG TPA: dienelactone hydrolase family protein [Ramlibacter sp.]|jgi:phospholipase/carboxylesterase|uniref:alpha/beta hydrolase n=1 Tax=Ramlibacter sp. TaxID=1917967 RepID=UPI002D598D44|nr:dienelactone hydrolase family protein [Ramlibacter sp.]HZY20415.1 dienelactone hydrolase family protein [Ramlibacter sp.]